MGVGGRDGDEAGVAQADESADDGPAEARRVVVGEDEEAVVGALGEAQSEVLLELGGDDDAWLVHIAFYLNLYIYGDGALSDRFPWWQNYKKSGGKGMVGAEIF